MGAKGVRYAFRVCRELRKLFSKSYARLDPPQAATRRERDHEGGKRNPQVVKDDASVGISLELYSLAGQRKLARGVPWRWLVANQNDDNARLERQAFSILEFCKRWDVSLSHYHKLKRLGRGPREIHLGNVIRITREAELEFQRDREYAKDAERAGQAQRRKMIGRHAAKAAVASLLHVSKRGGHG